MKTERLKKNDNPFHPNFKTLMAGVRPNSVGKKTVSMMMETMLEGGAAIASENPSLKVALNRVKWTDFAEEWVETAQEERVVLVTGSYGYRSHQIETLEIGTLRGETLAIPVKLRMQMAGEKNVSEWLDRAMPAFTRILRNKRIVKVMVPGDLAYGLLRPGETDAALGPVVDPVMCASLCAFGLFARYDNTDRIQKSSEFGLKLAVYHYVGAQHGPYLEDEIREVANRSARRLLDWPDSGHSHYSRDQKRWIREMMTTGRLAVLDLFRRSVRRVEEEGEETEVGAILLDANEEGLEDED